MPYNYEEKCTQRASRSGAGRKPYEPGKPGGENDGRWRQKLGSRTEELRYLKSAERYWYGESFGSEKRQKPA
jgi:hypothetical protein